MPIYVYRAATGRKCPHCVDGFDALQGLNEPAMTGCPECGAPIARVLTAPNLVSPKPSLTEENIGKHGFTQYRKAERGVYEKTVGKGPNVISDKD